jgi:hypothetical protein
MFMVHLWIEPYFPASSTSLVLATKQHQKIVTCCHFRVYKSIIHQDSVVSVVTRLWAEHSGVQFLIRLEIFLLQNALNNPALYSMDTQGSFLRVKQPRRETDHSLPSSAKVKDQQTHTLPPPPLPQPISPDKSITLIKSWTFFQDLLPYLILSVTSILQLHAPTNLLVVTAQLNNSVWVSSNSVTLLLKSCKVVQNLKCSAYAHAHTKSKVISKLIQSPSLGWKLR